MRYGLDLGVGSRSYLARELWSLGFPEQALQHSQAARTLAEEVAHPLSLAQALVYAAIVHQCRREVLAAHAQAAAAMTLATEQGFAQWVARGTVLHGWALAMQGQGEAGLAAMRQGLAADLATGATLYQPYFLGLLAEAYGAGGHPDEGLTALAEALAVMDTTELRYYAAELYRLKGALLLQQAVPDAAQAEACFHQALDVARQQQAKSWELRAATSLARLWQSQGKRQEAYDLLAPVYDWFTEGFDTADSRRRRRCSKRWGDNAGQYHAPMHTLSPKSVSPHAPMALDCCASCRILPVTYAMISGWCIHGVAHPRSTACIPTDAGGPATPLVHDPRRIIRHKRWDTPNAAGARRPWRASEAEASPTPYTSVSRLVT